MKKFNVLSESRKIRTKLLAMLVIGCSVISQLTSIPAYAGTSSDVNIALGKTATASSSCYTEYPSKAVNGTCSYGSDKWCTGNIGGEKWLQLDLGKNYNINRWVVYHAGVVETNHLNYNTRDFRLQKSDDGITWYDVDTVVQNSSSITERTVTTFNTRYVRLYIDCGQQNDNNCARIFEFQLFCDEEVNLALNRPVSASKELSHQPATSAVNGTHYSSEKWCTGNFDGEKWLTVDLERVLSVNRWKVVHAGICENADYNTKIFGLQASLNGVDWETIDYEYNNNSSITDRIITPCNARYFRLWIDQATQYDNSCARIFEFQLFCDEEVNLALNRPVSASKELSHEPATSAVNGNNYNNWSDKWCTGNFDGEKWLTVDLERVLSVNRWRVVHAGDIEKDVGFNTKIFGLQASLNGVDWETIDYVYNNNSSITDRIITPCTARYFRLWIDQATQYDNSCARIYEFQLF